MNRHVRDLPSGMVAEEGCTSPFNDPARTRSTSSHIMSSLKQLRSTMNKKTKSISNQIRKKVKSIKMPQCILTCVRPDCDTPSLASSIDASMDEPQEQTPSAITSAPQQTKSRNRKVRKVKVSTHRPRRQWRPFRHGATAPTQRTPRPPRHIRARHTKITRHHTRQRRLAPPKRGFTGFQFTQVLSPTSMEVWQKPSH